MIKYVLWDVDATLLNFELAEKEAFKKCFEEFSLSGYSDSKLEDYTKINKKYRQKLEKGQISKKEVLVKRFEEFFKKYSYDTSLSDKFNQSFQKNLANSAVFNENTKEILEYLSKKYKQFATTNGTKIAQEGKLKKSGLDKILDKVFISDELGYEKPSPKFFEKVFEYTKDYDKDSYVIIGDSLTSDMQGGKNIGIKTIWYNPKKITNTSGLEIDHTVSDLIQIKDIL